MPKPMITDVSIDYLPASRIQFPVSADRPAGFEGKNPLEFAPIAHQVEYGGKQIYLSKLYQYRDDYPVVFAYVDDGQQLRPALLYYSKSHAIWRVAPATKGKFAKAHGEFSCDLPPLLNIAMMKKFNPAIEAQQYNQMQGKITDFVNAFTAPIVGHLEASPAFVAETVGPENAEKIFHLNGSAIIYNLIKSEALDQIDSAIHEKICRILQQSLTIYKSRIVFITDISCKAIYIFLLAHHSMVNINIYLQREHLKTQINQYVFC